MWEMYWLERRIKSTEFAIYQNVGKKADYRAPNLTELPNFKFGRITRLGIAIQK